MSRFIQGHRSQFGRVSVVLLTIFGLVMMGGFAFLSVGSANAVQLASRSDTIDDSEHSVTNVQHTFVYTTPTAWDHDDSTVLDDMRIRIAFPIGTNDSYGTNDLAPGDVTVTCTACDSIVPTVTTVAEDSRGGAGGNDRYLITIDFETADTDTTISANAVWTVTLGTGATGIDNPVDNPAATDTTTDCVDGATAADADVCTISIEVDEDDGGFVADDSGDVLIAHISDVTVSVTVDESLTFSIDPVTNANCDTSFSVLAGPDSTSSAIDFGTISTFDTFIHACQDLLVVTNASGGYVLTAETDTSLQSGAGVEIGSGVCDGACTASVDDTWATDTNNGFAYSCDTLTNDDGGDACNLTTEVTDYKRFACIGIAADCDPTSGESAETVMSDSDEGDDSVRLQYKLSIDPVQGAAIYTTQVTYIATPTF